MATKEDNRKCACFAKPIGILQFVDTKEKKKNKETEPILRACLYGGELPGWPSYSLCRVEKTVCLYETELPG